MNAFLTISDDYSRAKSGLRVTAYEVLLGAPASARSLRKAKDRRHPTALPRRGLAAGRHMDDLIIQITGTEERDLFVDGYFNARRIGDTSSGGEKEEGGGEGGGTTPPPENPPASNP